MIKRIIVFLILCLILPSLNALGETKEILAEGEYVMGAGETMVVAEERALKKAEQSAAEQAGVFIKSFTQVKNLQVAEDVIEAVANHSMKVNVLDRKKTVVGDLDAIRFYVRIKAVVTTEEVEANLRKIREDSGIIDAYRKLKSEFERQSREMDVLKKKLSESTGETKKQVLTEITDEEKRFKANLWLEKANHFSISPVSALNAANKAIELNPSLAAAYLARARICNSAESVAKCFEQIDKGQGQCEQQLANENKALIDLNRAIALDKGYADAYAERASIYANTRDIEWRRAYSAKAQYEALNDIKKKFSREILADLNEAIRLKPDSHRFYEQRAQIYDPLDEADKALDDITKAIVLCRESDCGLLNIYYTVRATLYSGIGKKELAELDRKTAEEARKEMGPGKGMDSKLAASEIMKLQKEIFPDTSLQLDEKKKQEKLKEIDRRISRRQGTAEDYILRADLNSDDKSLADYAEAIRLLKKRKGSARDELLFARVQMFRALLYLRDKKFDFALNEFKQAKALIDKHLSHALEVVKAEDFAAVMKGANDKAAAMRREEAEAFMWMTLAVETVQYRAMIYEELSMPAKARSEYQYLCTTFRDEKACNDAERLKQ